jgi:fused signal recognition particle receptor
MESLLYIVIGLVVVGAVVFFAMRSKGKALPEAADTEKPKPAPAKASSAASPPPPPVAKAKAAESVRKAPAAPESLASTDVLPVDDSVPRQSARKIEPAPIELVSEPPPPKLGDVAGIRKGLSATRGGFIAKLAALFGGKKTIDPSILAEIEEVMLTSDVGVKTTQALLERLRGKLDRSELKDGNAVWAALREEATRILTLPHKPLAKRGDQPLVVLMVGVNGVGKTTTIGKLATKFVGEGSKVTLAAGDTFRAAAVQQLEAWGKRVGAEVVRGKDGADPGAVAFEATQKAEAAHADFLLVDTAGRLHTKAPLMDEIKKVRKTIDKAMPGAPHETLLVLDATTGQNALTQAQMFKDAVDLTGIILTKLDGTAKGGIVLGICDELKLPVRFIGLGERAEDLREFSPIDFSYALFGDEEETSATS